MSKHRDFDAARAAKAQEPLTFTLGGVEWTVPLPLPIEPVFELSKLAEMEVTDGKANLQEMVDALDSLRTFIADMLEPADRERFVQVSRDCRADFETLVDIAAWFIEEVTGDPLDGQSPSPTSPSPTGTPSTVAAALAASTSSQPMPTPAST